MSVAEPRAVIVELDLNENGGKHTFWDENELKSWIQEEIDSWKWFEEALRPDKELRKIFPENIHATLDSARKLLNSTSETRFRDVQERLHTIFVNDRMPCAHGKYGKLIADVRQTDVGLAARIAACYMQKVSGHPRTQAIALAEFRLSAFQFGMSDAAAEKQALTGLATEWAKSNRELLDECMKRHNEMLASIEALNVAAKSQETLYNEQVSEHETRMRSIEKMYTDAMAIRIAVKYWDDRATENGKSAGTWGKAAAGAFVVGLLLLWILLAWFDSPPTVVAKAIAAAGAAGTPLTPEMIDDALGREWLSFVTTKAIFLLLLIWPVRILVRNYLSHAHLQADAKERQLVIQTYLALLNDPDIQGDKELKAQILPKALENIFRHTQTGMVRDDALPQAGLFSLVPKG